MATKKEPAEQPQETAVPYMDAAPFPAPPKAPKAAPEAAEPEVVE